MNPVVTEAMQDMKSVVEEEEYSEGDEEKAVDQVKVAAPVKEAPEQNE